MMPHRRLAAFALLASLFSATAAHAQSTSVDVSVVDTTAGKTLPIYPHRRALYVVGVSGHRYALTLHNRLPERVMVVLSVDGINVITGQTAAPDQPGYVLAPYAHAQIDGWRKDLRSTAAFVFGTKSNSYAARTGRPDNVGVIGAAIFRERPRAPMPAVAVTREAAAPAARANGLERAETKSDPADETLGTGHGERLWSPVSTTDFVRASTHPDSAVIIYYGSEARLRAEGILPPKPRRPEAFPGSFVPDPPAE